MYAARWAPELSEEYFVKYMNTYPLAIHPKFIQVWNANYNKKIKLTISIDYICNNNNKKVLGMVTFTTWNSLTDTLWQLFCLPCLP